MKSEKISEKEMQYLESKLKKTPGKYLSRYLRYAPSWIREEFALLTVDRNNKFIVENDEIEFVFFLVSGMVKAADYSVFGIVYDYMWFCPVHAFGAVEILLGMKQYATTLVTFTTCKFIILSKESYEKWMKEDSNASLEQMKSTCNYLLEQSKKERIFLFAQGEDRLFLFLMRIYTELEESGKCTIELTRQELADGTGLCVKTIDRNMKKMITENYISRIGRKITISEKQYLRMDYHIAKKVSK